MGVLDYIDGISLFSPYELKCVEMYVDEFVPLDDPLFGYLREVSLRDVELYWYFDGDDDVLGGFHYPSRNAIYVNRSFAAAFEGGGHFAAASRVAMVFPTIMHELCHYWQSRRYGWMYLFMQLPLVREVAIEPQANEVSDRLYSEGRLHGMTMRELAELKRRHGFGTMLFDPEELAALGGGRGVPA